MSLKRIPILHNFMYLREPGKYFLSIIIIILPYYNHIDTRYSFVNTYYLWYNVALQYVDTLFIVFDLMFIFNKNILYVLSNLVIFILLLVNYFYLLLLCCLHTPPIPPFPCPAVACYQLLVQHHMDCTTFESILDRFVI